MLPFRCHRAEVWLYPMLDEVVGTLTYVLQTAATKVVLILDAQQVAQSSSEMTERFQVFVAGVIHSKLLRIEHYQTHAGKLRARHVALIQTLHP